MKDKILFSIIDYFEHRWRNKIKNNYRIKEDFDVEPEQRFAVYFDEAEAIEWRRRVVAKDSGDLST